MTAAAGRAAGAQDASRHWTARLAIALATAGGVGFLPWAPGTFGSLVGVALFAWLCHLGLGLYLVTLLALTALAVWVSDRALAYFGRPDDRRIVIDEVVGQLWLFTPLVPLVALDFEGLRAPQAALAGFSLWAVLLVTGFVLFRVLDIAKPGPIRWAEDRFDGGVGVVADDALAGALGALVLSVILYAVVLLRLGSAVAVVSPQGLLGVGV